MCKVLVTLAGHGHQKYVNKNPEGNQMMWEQSIHNNQQHMLIVRIEWTTKKNRIIRKTSTTTTTMTRTATIKYSFIFNELLPRDKRRRKSYIFTQQERPQCIRYSIFLCVLLHFFLAQNTFPKAKSHAQNHSIGFFSFLSFYFFK